MSRSFLASIVISSYNYGRFLKDCIDSALNQTYPDTEVIVVDDASTDNSREIIAGYGDRIIPVLRQKNEGGRATYNAACRVSRGEVILILDSDDMLCPAAVEQATELFRDPDVVKVHWPLWEIDTRGRKTGGLDPGPILPEGDFRERIVCGGPFDYAFPSTSGNAYSRRFVEKALPIPPGAYGDAYLAVWALASGAIKRIPEPQGFYRVHGHNTYTRKTSFDERVERDLRHAEQCCRELSAYYREKGINVDTEVWKRGSWHHRLYLSAQDIKALIPAGDAFILVDEDNWGAGGVVAGRRALPFPERDGYYSGAPADDADALREFERLRRAGPGFLVFAWQAFWWLDYYPDLHRHLRANFRCVLENDRLVAFDLRKGGAHGR
jgi:glycosyltransferase involved in cell wall biosynthesis